MKFNTEELISILNAQIEAQIKQVENLKSQSLENLNRKKSKESWSALECIEHLNLYGDFYLPEIQKRISTSKYKSGETFNSGVLGNYFANSMLPKEKLNKMKTFKDKNPNGSRLDMSSLDRFLKQQKDMLTLLDSSRKVSLTKTKNSISISKMIKLRLGDTFRFVLNHNDRHIAQAKKALLK